jgi:mannose-6-phosphate isomerase-like protein (cupin superfamily)
MGSGIRQGSGVGSMKRSVGPNHIESTYVHLGPDGASVPLAVTESFWADLGSGRFDHLGAGRLVSQFACKDSWASWEMHPDGEELVVLVSGSVDLILSSDGTETSVSLRSPGAFAIVPRGTWHTANVHEPSTMLFVTPGEGTEHKER